MSARHLFCQQVQQIKERFHLAVPTGVIKGLFFVLRLVPSAALDPLHCLCMHIVCF